MFKKEERRYFERNDEKDKKK